jgi:hypothetical protein
MPIIDVQVHAYERNHPARPWAGQLHGSRSADGEEMVAAMDAVGVDASIIVCRAYAEPLALRIGYSYQAAHDWHLRVPPMAA